MRNEIRRKKDKINTASDSYPRTAAPYTEFRFAAGLVVIVAATVIAYIPAFYAGYIWDDDKYVTDNPLVLDSDGLYRIWFSQDSPSQYFPMVYTGFRLEYKLWGLNPSGYHINNVILHIINTVLLWILLRHLSIPADWLIAAIFALHPVQVESVAWITERKNLLMSLFFFLSLIAYLRFVNRTLKSQRTWHIYILSLVLYAAALLSKTTACTMPAALILILWIKHVPLIQKRWVEVIPYILLGLAMGLLTLWWELHIQGAARLDLGLSVLDRILLACRAIWFYLAKLIWPVNLTFSYPKWVINSSDPLQYVWVLACAAAGFCLWFWRKQVGRGTAAAVFFFVATLFPMLGFFTLSTFRYTYVADHYQYMASIGPIALVTTAGYSLTRYRGRGFKNFAILIVGLALAALGLLTWRQSLAYKDGKTLWEDTLRKNPQSFMACNSLGVVYSHLGRDDQAIEAYQKAISIWPGYAEAYYNLGTAYVVLGRHKEAIESYQRTIQLKPDFADAYNNLGISYDVLGRHQEAIEAYQKAIRSRLDYAEAHYNLGLAYSRLGRYEDAIGAYRQAIKIKPDDAKSYNNLGAAYNNLGRYQEAIKVFGQAIRIQPDHANAYLNLGRACHILGRYEDAIVAYRQAIKLKPDFADAHLSLGLACLAIGDKDSATKEYEILKPLNAEMADSLLSRINK